jgi:hypothetical protein
VEIAEKKEIKAKKVIREMLGLRVIKEIRVRLGIKVLVVI